MSSSDNVRSNSTTRVLRTTWMVAAFCFLYSSFIQLPTSPMTWQLDPSWCAAITHFAAQGLQWGRDVIFTYGPLGHLVACVYTGELFGPRVLWELTAKAAFALLLLLAMRRMRLTHQLLFFAFTFVFICGDLSADALVFLPITAGALLLLVEERSSSSLLALCGILFGACALIKFTYFILVVLAVAMISWSMVVKTRSVLSAYLPFIVCLTIAVLWLIAGQQAGNFPAYLLTSIDVSVGYKEAMGKSAEHSIIPWLGAAELFLGIIFLASDAIYRRSQRGVIVSIFLAAVMFLAWNRAFIRADDHVVSFFAVYPLLFLLPCVDRASYWSSKRIFTAAVLAAGVISLASILIQRPASIILAPANIIGRISQEVRFCLRPTEFKQQLDTSLAVAREKFKLSRTATEVGSHTIDVFGQEQGIALLNNFNYTPRPVFQSYSAYTPRLLGLNRAFYLSSRAPDYVLVRLWPIDDRYTALEDSGVLTVLLYDYQPLFQEYGYTLWKRKVQPQFSEPTYSKPEKIALGQRVQLPASPVVLVKLQFYKTIWGHFLSSFLHPAQLEFLTTIRNDEWLSDRLIPSMAEAGFIISPRLLDSRDLINLATASSAQLITNFGVRPYASRLFYKRNVMMQTATLPALTPPSQDETSALAERNVIFSADTNFDGFLARHDVEVKQAGEYLQIRVTGPHPEIEVPALTGEGVRDCNVTVDMDAPASGVAALSYHISTGQNSIARLVATGSNKLNFWASDPEADGNFVFIPGTAQGEYRLYKVQVTAHAPISIAQQR